MKLVISKIFLLLLVAISHLSMASETNKPDQIKSASGAFEINLEPQKDEEAPAGRMIIHKKYSGDLEGTGIGQMLSKRTEKGASAYSAIEEFEGSLAGKNGSFTLVHNGYMSAGKQSLEVKVLEGSGKGELEDISGALQIIQEDGKHKYVLTYEL